MPSTFPSSTVLVILTIMVSIQFITFSTVDASVSHQMDWPVTPTCQGFMGECMTNADEFEMDTEINRRILATSQYISYEALKRNSVPCSRRGASYYNCKAGAQANPYNRGCSAITRCRG